MLTRVLPITLALWTTVARAQLYFVNPPRFGTEGDFSSNAVYSIGQNLRVQWSEAPENVGISVLLYQLKASNGDYMLPGQYLFQNVVNTTTYDWTVAVSENLPATLDESNLFYLSVFREGQKSSDSNSHYFNITEAKSTATSSSTTTTTSGGTASSTSTDMATSVLPATATSATATPESTTTQPAASTNTGMSIQSKIGIGVGIPLAAVIGIGLGWFFFGRRRGEPAKGESVATDPRESAASFGYDPRAGNTGVSEYNPNWPQHNYQYEALAKQTPPPQEVGYNPPLYEASGESRVTEPAELYAEPPQPGELPGHHSRRPM